MTRRRDGRFARLAGALLAVGIAASARATDRFYHDQSVTSPSSRYRLDAKSPDNAGERRRAFAARFTYTLTDTQTNRVLWTRTQPSRESSPLDLFVHDDLWVVIHTSRDRIVILEPLTATRLGEVDVLDQFTKDENRNVAFSTAGPVWTGRSRWSFLEHDGRMHFVVRPWWDRRVIVDLTDGTVVDSPSDDLLRACDEDDRAFVMAELQDGSRRYVQEPRNWRERRRIIAAVHIAGRMQVREAVPLLRDMEALSAIGISSFGGQGLEDGAIDPTTSADSIMRQSVHLALRRNGEKPTELPCTWFSFVRDGREDKWVEIPPLPGPRAERVDMVREGMMPMEVLEAIGAPDWRRDAIWEYEMDVDPPYTLCIYWHERRAVGRIERITPPLWQQGNKRDVMLE